MANDRVCGRRGARSPTTTAPAALTRSASASRQAPCAASAGSSASAAFAAAPKPAMPGTFSVPARSAALLAAAVQAARQRGARSGDQRADALRAAQLVGRQRQRVGAQCLEVDARSCRPPAPRRRAASRRPRAPPRRRRRPAGSRPSRCWPPSGRPACAARRPGARTSQTRSATPSASTRQSSSFAPEALAVSATASCSVAPTMIRSQPAASALSMASASASVPPLTKVTAAGVHADQRRDVRPRLLDARPRRPTGRVHRRRVAALGQRRGDRRRGLGTHLRGRVVIQVDAHAAASAGEARRSLPLATSASETLAR